MLNKPERLLSLSLQSLWKTSGSCTALSSAACSCPCFQGKESGWEIKLLREASRGKSWQSHHSQAVGINLGENHLELDKTPSIIPITEGAGVKE